MTDRADELRRLADRVEAGEWETRDQLRALALEIANALYGKEAAQQVLIELIEDALKGSVDAAKRLVPEGYDIEVYIGRDVYSPEKETRIAFARPQGEPRWSQERMAKAQDEAHARLALALRVWAEMGEEG